MIVISRTVDLSRPVQTETLRGSEFEGEEMAHEFRISVMRDGEPVTLTGTVTASFLQPNDIALDLWATSGIADGQASVKLPQACYEVPGRFRLSIYYTETANNVTDTTCIYSCVGSVVVATSDPMYDPGEPISLAELIADAKDAAETAEAALSAATHLVRYDVMDPPLSDADKAQARTNIGAAAEITLDVATVAETKTYLDIT